VGGAEQLYRRAWAIKERTLGPDHLDLTMTLLNLGCLIGDHDLIERSRAIFRSSLAPDHPKVALAQEALAMTQHD
jgi:hypothetical protein